MKLSRVFTLSFIRSGLIRALLVLTTLALLLGFATLPVHAKASSQLVITPIMVRPGAYVYLEVDNMPPDVNFAVTMGPAGSQGVGGGLVAHFSSGSGGTNTYRFEIHESVRFNNRVDIRIDSGTGFAASSYFNNSPLAILQLPTLTQDFSPKPAPAPVRFDGPVGLRVLRVDQGGVVVAEISNLPTGADFTVSIAPARSFGLDGYDVAHFSTANLKDGVLVGTFEIPYLLRNVAQLELQVSAQGNTFYTSFHNASTN